MENLPSEIIEIILINPDLSVQDLINFSLTCKYFRELIITQERMWKIIYRQNWSNCEQHLKSNDIKINSYFNETMKAHKLYEIMFRELEKMPKKFSKKLHLSEIDLEPWDIILGENCRNYWYVVNYLMEIVNSTGCIDTPDVIPLSTPGNKTNQYYALKALRHVRQKYLSLEWEKYKRLPAKEQMLEKGAILISQWCQPQVEISYMEICNKFRNIVSLIRDKLKLINENHRLFKIYDEYAENWEKHSIDDNVYTKIELHQLIDAVRDVMFVDLGFSGNAASYYMPTNSYIDHALDAKVGQSITLGIIYEAVVRRIGIKCHVLCFPDHSLVKILDPDESWFYIDIYNSGNLIGRGGCPAQRGRRWHISNPDSFHNNVSKMNVLIALANTLEVSARHHSQGNGIGKITRLRSSMELLQLISPDNMQALLNLGRLYIHQGIDTSKLEKFIFEMTDRTSNSTPVMELFQKSLNQRPLIETIENKTRPVPYRPSALKYAVGMVMTHLALDYKCVIHDWDTKCMASENWQEQMHVDMLKLGANQPFYNVLDEDGSHRYVAQENLHPTKDTGFLYLNDETGRHFSHFFHTHYVPNSEKENEYPEDKQVRMLYHTKLLNDKQT